MIDGSCFEIIKVPCYIRWYRSLRVKETSVLKCKVLKMGRILKDFIYIKSSAIIFRITVKKMLTLNLLGQEFEAHEWRPSS